MFKQKYMQKEKRIQYNNKFNCVKMMCKCSFWGNLLIKTMKIATKYKAIHQIVKAAHTYRKETARYKYSGCSVK